ncbi:MAG: rhodanese-like domain-containing protein [Chloroflexi bacterium]|nr:rhodanese-like domain-containing protein [Chloroflexota bacterium]
MNLFKSLFGAASASSTSMNAQEAKARLDGESAPYILDVRQPDEYKQGHIPAAVLIPLDRLSAEMSKLPKDHAILCVCRSGARSGSAVRMLNGAGYEAFNLRGGMMAWHSAGFPVKRGK